MTALKKYLKTLKIKAMRQTYNSSKNLLEMNIVI